MIAGPMTFVLAEINRMDALTSRTDTMNSSTHAARTGFNSGSVTVRIVASQVAPHTRAHSSTLLSSCRITPATVRTPSGKKIVRYARMISHNVPYTPIGMTIQAHRSRSENTIFGTACGNIT